MMTTELWAGFEIVAAVTLMTLVVCPMLLWVLPDRIHGTPLSSLPEPE